MQNDRTMTLDELIRQRMDAKLLCNGYEELSLDVPEPVQERVENLENRIKRIVRGELKAKLAALEAQAEALKPNDVKLAEAQAAITALKAKLA